MDIQYNFLKFRKVKNRGKNNAPIKGAGILVENFLPVLFLLWALLPAGDPLSRLHCRVDFFSVTH